MKRGFDIAVSALLLLILALPVLILMGVIRLTSPGPALFRQTRVGRHGVPFTCYKLRSMRSGIAQKPTHQAQASDITGVGHFLRRSKLDEVPQLINVIRGEMSLVGPRPCLPSQQELIAARKRLGVLALRPGITGVAQVAGVDMSDPERLAHLDARYIGREGLGTDIALLVATVSPTALSDRVRTGGERDGQ